MDPDAAKLLTIKDELLKLGGKLNRLARIEAQLVKVSEELAFKRQLFAAALDALPSARRGQEYLDFLDGAISACIHLGNVYGKVTAKIRAM